MVLRVIMLLNDIEGNKLLNNIEGNMLILRVRGSCCSMVLTEQSMSSSVVTYTLCLLMNCRAG